MVHALGELYRVLRPGGYLLDIRPLVTDWPVEVASGTSSVEAGRLTGLPDAMGDDKASEEAVAAAAAQGWFRKEEQQTFPYLYSWDTPSEMKEYLDSEWEDSIRLEETVLRAAQSAWAIASAEARVRVRVSMQIARWKKI